MSYQDAAIRQAIGYIPVVGSAINFITGLAGGGVWGGETEQEAYNRIHFYEPWARQFAATSQAWELIRQRYGTRVWAALAKRAHAETMKRSARQRAHLSARF